MTIKEIETKIGASYHKSIVQQRVIDMWNIIGDNYEIVEVDWSPKRILIPDEIYNKLNKQTVALSLKDSTKHSVIITKVSDWNNLLKRRQTYYTKTQKKNIAPYGIYCIKHQGTIIYIGMTQTSFEQRWKEHKKFFKAPETNDMYLYQKGLRVEDLTFEPMVDLTKEKADKELNIQEIKAMEMGLIAYFKPEFNISGVKIPYRFN